MQKRCVGAGQGSFARRARLATKAAGIAVIAAIGAAMPASGAAQFEFENHQQVEPPGQLRAPIARWAQVMDGEDAARIAEQYVPQGWLKLPCAPAGFGRAAIADRWRDALSLSPANLSLHPSSFELSRGGDMAIERGWAQLMQNVGGLPYATNVDYVRVWSRTAGSWLVAADLFAPGGPCAETAE